MNVPNRSFRSHGLWLCRHLKQKTAALTALLLAVLMACFIPLQAQAAQLAVTPWMAFQETASASVVLLEPESGAILYAKNAMDTHYPASITKLMTAVLAMEHCDPQEIVTFSHDAVYKNEGDTSNIARDVDEQMTMEHCLYGMLLASANECAWAIAEHVCDGDVNAFADLMNQKAAELGCVNTHFANPNGLHVENHTTCAYDMALIARAAWQYDLLREIMGTRFYKIPPTNKHDEETPLNNTHYMINNYKTAKYVYEDCVGGKTGYTPEAHSTLVTYGQRNGLTLIAVTMDVTAPNQYIDTIGLFDTYLSDVTPQQVSATDPLVLDALSAASAEGKLRGDVSQISLDGPLALALPAGAAPADCTFTVTPIEEADMTAALGIRKTGKDAALPYPEENAAGLLEVTWQDVTVGYAPLWYTGNGTYADQLPPTPEPEEEAQPAEEEAPEDTGFFGLKLPKLNLPSLSLPKLKLPSVNTTILIIILSVALLAAVIWLVALLVSNARRKKRRRSRYRGAGRPMRTIQRRDEKRKKNRR